MEYEESETEKYLLIRLFGNLDMLHAGVLKERIKSWASSKNNTVILDFEKVGFVDSSGFGLIMSLSDLLKSLGGGLKIIKISKTIQQIFKIAKIASVIETFESLEDATKTI